MSHALPYGIILMMTQRTCISIRVENMDARTEQAVRLNPDYLELGIMRQRMLALELITAALQTKAKQPVEFLLFPGSGSIGAKGMHEDIVAISGHALSAVGKVTSLGIERGEKKEGDPQVLPMPQRHSA